MQLLTCLAGDRANGWEISPAGLQDQISVTLLPGLHLSKPLDTCPCLPMLATVRQYPQAVSSAASPDATKGSHGWQMRSAVARRQAVPEILRRLHAAQAEGRRWKPPHNGAVVVIDGPSGAGKSHLASELAAVGRAESLALQGTVPLDDLVPGWNSLAAGVQAGREFLLALDAGMQAQTRSWNWQDSCPGDWITQPPLHGGVLLLEGCGSLASAAQVFERLVLLRVWVYAPPEVCLKRVRQRDAYSWDRRSWQAQADKQAQAWQQGPACYWPDLMVVG